MSAVRRTGYVWHELYGWHFGGMTPYERPGSHLRFVQPIPHVESPESKRRIHSLLEVSGILKSLVRLDPTPATEESVLRFHTKEYIDRIQEMSIRDGGEAGECAPFSPGAYNIALLSAGGVIKAVDAVLDRTVDNAYCLVRPPGHHAERDRGRGFCLLGNVAIAAFHALQVRGMNFLISNHFHFGLSSQNLPIESTFRFIFKVCVGGRH
jgi:acetoin utilization deacetylase AcuC-like enzyme